MVETDKISTGIDGKDLFGCEPWFPPPEPPEDPTEPNFLQETRGRYIMRLEEKLLRVKGLSREATPRDLMTAMQKLHAASMQLLASTGSIPGLDDDDDWSSDEVSSSAFTRKFHPERVALSAEEKAKLMDHDILAKHAVFPDDKPPRPLLMGWIPIDYEDESPVATDSEEDDPNDPYRRSLKKRSTRKRKTIKSPTATTPTAPTIPEEMNPDAEGTAEQPSRSPKPGEPIPKSPRDHLREQLRRSPRPGDRVPDGKLYRDTSFMA